MRWIASKTKACSTSTARHRAVPTNTTGTGPNFQLAWPRSRYVRGLPSSRSPMRFPTKAHARTRVEGAACTSPFPSPKSATLDPCTPRAARVART
jgi:hypothetical protein